MASAWRWFAEGKGVRPTALRTNLDVNNAFKEIREPSSAFSSITVAYCELLVAS
jgi:hypothetical protein